MSDSRRLHQCQLYGWKLCGEQVCSFPCCFQDVDYYQQNYEAHGETGLSTLDRLLQDSATEHDEVQNTEEEES